MDVDTHLDERWRRRDELGGRLDYAFENIFCRGDERWGLGRECRKGPARGRLVSEQEYIPLAMMQWMGT